MNCYDSVVDKFFQVSTYKNEFLIEMNNDKHLNFLESLHVTFFNGPQILGYHNM